MDVLRERPSDFSAVVALVASAFPTDAEARLVQALHTAGDVVVSAIAVDQGAIVGHALMSRMTGPFPAVGLGPVAVLQGRRNRGIGTRVVAHALNMARDESWIGAFVLGDPRFYARFGFSVGLASGFRSPYAGSHFMVAALTGTLPALSGEVGYAPAFADLK